MKRPNLLFVIVSLFVITLNNVFAICRVFHKKFENKSYDLFKKNVTKNNLIECLRNFKISGSSIAISPNIAFLVGSRNLGFNVFFEDKQGKVKKRRYEASIKSVGLAAEISFGISLIFFVNTNIDFSVLDNEIIQLGRSYAFVESSL
jgi:hypothetical protein